MKLINLTGRFKQAPLKVKLVLLAVLPLALMLTVLAGIVLHLQQANARIGSLYSDRVIPLQQLKQVSDAYAIELVDTTTQLMAELIPVQSALLRLTTAKQTATQAWQGYLQTGLVPEEIRLIKVAEPQLQQVAELLQLVHQAAETKNSLLLQQIVSQQLYPSVDALGVTLKQLSAIQLAEAERLFLENKQNLYRAYLTSAAVVVAVLLFTVLLIRVLSAVTLQSISSATRSTAELLASGSRLDKDKNYIPEVKSHLLDTIEHIRQQLGFSIEETMKLLGAISVPVIAIWDRKGKVSSVNYAFERQFACSREDVVGQYIENLPLWPANEATLAIQHHLKAVRDSSSAVFQIQLEINQGQWGNRQFFVTVSSWRERKQAVALMVFEDVTAWHKRELWLSSQIIRDPLTNLFNRDGFTQVITDLWSRWKNYGEPFALVMADLNDFKAINDTYGHLTGDGVLKEFANRLQQSCRSSDICVRWGGDEFAVILTDCQTLFYAQQQVARLVASLQQNISVFTFSRQMQASFGCVHVSELSTTETLEIDELIQLADVRMYAEKRQTKQLAT